MQLILVAAGAIAVWLNQRRQEQAGMPADYDEDGLPDNRDPRHRSPSETRELTPVSRDGTDPEQAERVRRIQEEIRRKIAERRGQAAPPPIPTPAPTLEPFNPMRPVFREEASPRPVATPPPMPARLEDASDHDDSAALERQRRLAEQLAKLETARREARRAAQALSETGAASAKVRTEPAVIGARGLVAELRDPQALRRAMVLREVLDAPVALRGA